MCASFNDWQQFEMKTSYEIRIEKTNVEKNDWRIFYKKHYTDDDTTKHIKSKKKDENIVQFVNFIPPGKHFFYFVMQN